MKLSLFKLLSFGAVLALASPVPAWKPVMHASLADLAVEDALDGTVDILIEPAGRPKIGNIRPLPGSVRRPGGQTRNPGIARINVAQLKRYAVDRDLVEAIRSYRAYYRAGTLGPDAYPDLLTGQMIIHTDEDTNAPGGTNAWLTHLWNQSLNWKRGTEEHKKVRAFVAGYLTHGAGDMFAHSYVNNYAGGDFDATSTNFLRHLVLEGYIGQRAPQLASTELSIDGIEGFIYTALIDARKGTFLADRLYKGETVIRSLPYVFSTLRDRLAAQVDDYNRHKDDVGRTFSLPLVLYYQEWIKDIDAGLKAFPRLSHEIARRLVLFDHDRLDEKKKKDELTDLVTDYKNNHLLAMMGAPDFVGAAGVRVAEIEDKINEAIERYVDDLVSPEQREALKNSILNFLIQGFTGGKYRTFDEFIDVVKAPENYFDQVMSAQNRPKDSRGRPLGEAISLNELKADLEISGGNERFKADAFAPAYNTLTMSKLILLSPDGVKQLMADLGKPISQAPANLMLGYVRKFDGSAQWTANPEKMLLEEKGVFDRVFRDQAGSVPVERETVPVKKTYEVTLQIERVKAVSSGIDPVGAPDFFPKMFIGAQSKTMDARDDQDDVSPNNWRYTRTITADTVDVALEIWDEDGNLFGDDDLCDASPSANTRRVKVEVDLRQLQLSGVVSGGLSRSYTVRGNGSDSVEVTFKVSVREL